MGEGTRLTTSADPLVQRQSLGGTTSDGEPRETDARSRPGDLEDHGTESHGHRHASATRLSAAAAASCLCRQTQWQTQRLGDSHKR
jgi:hypothetical protein